MAITLFALSLTIYDMFTSQVKCQMFYLENKGRGQEENRDLRPSSGNIRFHRDANILPSLIFGVFLPYFAPLKEYEEQHQLLRYRLENCMAYNLMKKRLLYISIVFLVHQLFISTDIIPAILYIKDRKNANFTLFILTI